MIAKQFPKSLTLNKKAQDQASQKFQSGWGHLPQVPTSIRGAIVSGWVLRKGESFFFGDLATAS